ncbi:MAG TPA: mechanosensitive ion channel family protein [Halothiobacillus sp.]|nr:mechanosensitive ion channel family protein [Halothiobacillus sp.]
MENSVNMFFVVNWADIGLVALQIGIVLVAAKISTSLLRRGLARLEKRLVHRDVAVGVSQIESAKRIETLVRLIRQAIIILIWAIAILVVLSQLGLSIAPILASAGVVGLAVGFGAQALVRDMITGFFIILENQIRVGDVAIINGTGGLVEEINLRTIVLRDVEGRVHVFPNGSINTMTNATREWSAYVFRIGVAYKENTDRVIEVIQDVLDGMVADEEFGPKLVEAPEIQGVDELTDSAVIIRGRLKTIPLQQWTVGREFLRRVKLAFDEHGIEIPFPHRTIYFGEASLPFKFSQTTAKPEQGKP